jgi:hypothetical protein
LLSYTCELPGLSVASVIVIPARRSAIGRRELLETYVDGLRCSPLSVSNAIGCRHCLRMHPPVPRRTARPGDPERGSEAGDTKPSTQKISFRIAMGAVDRSLRGRQTLRASAVCCLCPFCIAWLSIPVGCRSFESMTTPVVSNFGKLFTYCFRRTWSFRTVACCQLALSPRGGSPSVCRYTRSSEIWTPAPFYLAGDCSPDALRIERRPEPGRSSRYSPLLIV